MLEKGEMPAQLNPLSAAIDTVETGGVITTVPTPQNNIVPHPTPTDNGCHTINIVKSNVSRLMSILILGEEEIGN